MKKYLPAYLLVLLGVTCRFLPHPANFAPITAIALFGAVYLPKKWSLALPLAAMMVSDLFIGFYTWQIMLSVYISFVLAAIIGWQVKQNKKTSTIIAGTLLGSVVFFFITNFSVWAFGTMYSHNFSGLMQSYYMALPFFRNSLLGDIFYTAALVGGYELVLHSRQLFTKKSIQQTI